MTARCPRGSSSKIWSLKDGRFRCAQCRTTFSDPRRPVKPSENKLRKLIEESVLEHSTTIILSRVDVSRYMSFRILALLQAAMAQDVPNVFEGTVEVDETYLGGQWKNNRLSSKCSNPKARRGCSTNKQAVFRIRCRNGKVWAELIDNAETKPLQSRILKQVKKSPVVFSDTWRGDMGIAAKGYVHRLVKHSKDTL